MSTVVVAGTGIIPFRKPGAAAPYDAMAREAATLALADAGIHGDPAADRSGDAGAELEAARDRARGRSA